MLCKILYGYIVNGATEDIVGGEELNKEIKNKHGHKLKTKKELIRSISNKF